MENAAFTWRRCHSCKSGRVALFTSLVACDKCAGTGIDLSDERLEVSLESLAVSVRTRKLLHCQGVDTIRQLLCFVASGRMAECASMGCTTVGYEIRELLHQNGLRIRAGRVLEEVLPR